MVYAIISVSGEQRDETVAGEEPAATEGAASSSAAGPPVAAPADPTPREVSSLASAVSSKSGTGADASTPERRFRYHQVLAGKYRLEKSLARGGMGWVFLATQLPLERKVAVKVLRTGSHDPAFRQRFLLEASTCAKLQHPHIVTIHDYGETEQGDLFMAMEFLDGPSLSMTLAKARRLSVERALRIVLQVARALRAAHKAGVVHRDLKPSNIMLLSHDEDERRDFVKVVDFGLAKLFESGGGAIELTRAGTLLGSPRYMAPEQIRNRDITPRTDVYSLGVILFYMLTGRPPFNSDNATDILAQHLRDPVPSLCDAAGDLGVPRELEQIVQRCMAKKPADRYPDVSALVAELKALYEAYLEGSLPSDTFNDLGDTVAAPLVGDLTTPQPNQLKPPPPHDLATPAPADPPSLSGAPAMTPAHMATGAVADMTPPPEPRRRRGAIWLLLLLLLFVGGAFMLFGGESEPDKRPVAITPPAPKAPPKQVKLTIRTDPPGLRLFDDAGADIGTSPIVVPTPTPAHPLRVRAKFRSELSGLVRVLPEPGAAEVTLDLRGWTTEVAAEAAGPARVDEDEPAPRRRRRRRRPERAPRPEPVSESPASAPLASEPPPTSEPEAQPEPARAEAPNISTIGDEPAVAPTADDKPRVGIIEDKKPRVDVIDDSRSPSVGLVDEAEAPKVGLIEE